MNAKEDQSSRYELELATPTKEAGVFLEQTYTAEEERKGKLVARIW
jgi:hypothetical protein